MRTFLKYLIIFLVVIALLAVGLMFLSPSKLVFEDSEVFEAPPQTVYNLVQDFKKWELWSPWQDIDPNAEHSYTTKTAGVGAQWSWKGNDEIGEGSQTMIEAQKNEFIKTALKFGGFDGESFSNWKFETVDNGKTKVTWDFDGAETPFVYRPFNFLMKKGQLNTYKKGLANLKLIVEERANENLYNGYKIQEVYVPAKSYIMNRQEVEMDKIQQFYTQNLSALFIKAQGSSLEMDGKDSALFYSWNESKGITDMAAAIPVKNAVNIPGAISQTLPDGKALQVDYYGDIDKTEVAHYAIADYMADKNLLVNYPIVQEYVTDPTTEKDPSKWLTKITYYIINSSQ